MKKSVGSRLVLELGGMVMSDCEGHSFEDLPSTIEDMDKEPP